MKIGATGANVFFITPRSYPMPTHTQTARIGGVRTRITTRDGVVTTQQAPPLEWELQAAACRALRRLPTYGKQFLFVGGMEAGRRGPKEATKAKATGLTAGHPDLTILLRGGTCAFIEYKAGSGRLSQAQKDRHAELASLGHTVEVVKADSEEECAAETLRLLCGWLAANDNENQTKMKKAI